ncbi:MAG: hypothetical protein ACRDNZ_13560 [Streptosporangiaceae bacterium]
MSGNGDVDGDANGEEAAWRELVASFDLPVDTAAAPAPWPAREDLNDTPSGRSLPERDTAVGLDQSGAAGRPGSVSRPAVPGLFSPDAAGPDFPGSGTGEASLADGPALGGAGGGVPGDRARIVWRAVPLPAPSRDDSPAGGGAASRGAADDSDDDADDDRYRAPPPEPLPQLDSVAKGAWAGLLGGPAYLVFGSMIGDISDFGALVAIVAFIAGGVTLFLRMNDRPRDDDDDGAVV